MDALVGSPARRDTEGRGHGDDEPRWRPDPEQSKGKGWHKSQKGRRIKCQFCWRPLSHPSGCDQHQWHNLNCLTWQYYLRGGCSWQQAEERAFHTKAARENYDPVSEHPEASGSGLRRSVPEPLEPPTPPPPPPPGRARHVRHGEEKEATCEVRLEERSKNKEKPKKEKKMKKGKRVLTPSPSPKPRRRPKRDPPSDPEDERKNRKVPKVTQVDAKTWVVKIC